tara:strand:- start:249 stop:1925 length:1677 start_codon:yes stop_codon:yes gene_type:complete
MQRNKLPEVMARAIVARGIHLDDVDAYLDPKVRYEMPDPMKLSGMAAGAQRIVEAVLTGEIIGIFADYDVDGATSAALLKKFLDAINVETRLYIPDRLTEGYGPNEIGLRKLKTQGASLVVTLDCGILAFTVLDQMSDEGLDIIVVDHHMAEPQLPTAKAVINPNRLDDDSGLGYLAAVGVTYMLVVAVNRALREAGWFAEKVEPNLLSFLDLVALGTVCDVVDLKGLNRAYVSQGLKVLLQQKNIGLRALRAAAKVDRKPDSYQLGFILGPRINASGRVGQSDIGALLLSTNDPNQADKMAEILEELNEERKMIEAKVLEQAVFEASKLPDEDPVVVVSGVNWHPGVIGIVAARLREKFDRPACVISLTGEIGKGSGRSILGWHLGSSIIAGVQSNQLLTGGGHAMAAGFSIEASKVEDFRKFLNDRYKRETQIGDIQSILKIDGVISAFAANEGLSRTLNKLEPFGAGNPEPRFVIPSLRVKYSSVVGEQHIRCSFISGDTTTIEGIAFRSIDKEIGRALLQNNGPSLHVAGKIRRNDWKGKTRMQVIVEDLALTN